MRLSPTALAALLLLASAARSAPERDAADPHAGHGEHSDAKEADPTGHEGHGAAADPHAGHHVAMKRATRSTLEVVLPRVGLVREDGASVTLPAELDDGRPVVLNFIYTTCTTICPVMSQTMTGLQAKLGAAGTRAHFVSVSIDPEQDTPARLAEYARRFRAGPQWHFYTGSVESSVAVQRAFSSFRGDKMDHTPATFLRAAPGRPWVRIDGFPSAEDLAREFRALVATR